MANELILEFELILGTRTIGANLLSRAISGKGVMDNLRPSTFGANQISVGDEIWNEHVKSHWGTFKTYAALKWKGSKATWKMVKLVCKMCEICAKF